ncbi:hypothetical protein G3N95_12145 [Paraburkholderia sp. Tr-20389]|uniref:hypothetical protein n=1 Tax=Paraburkholderia sp. Tr-20389 TaxID=2703903 RepID=UPI001981B65E|nr:hypothetical protein [Paraburkholderia sp. Tr-20389]MBN3753693.1 hypothetical protein [Paraburkholderia sp. Tr-20389]
METPEKQEFLIRFEELSPAEAGAQAQILKDALLDTTPHVEARIERDRTESMDLGATLVLVLGTPAVIAIAKGLAAFMAREREATLVIECDGRVIFKGNSSDAAKIAKALQSSDHPGR